MLAKYSEEEVATLKSGTRWLLKTVKRLYNRNQLSK